MSAFSSKRIFKRGIWILPAVMVLLTSCSAMREYPENWPPISGSNLVGSCPALTGLYSDGGESLEPHTGRACNIGGNDHLCTSLGYNLLSDIPNFFMYKGSSEFGSMRIKIDQRPKNIIEISLSEREAFELSLEKGDFTCGPDGLILESRSAATIVLISNAFVSESRIFRTADDGSLVMKIHSRVVAHHTIFPVVRSDEHWVKWSRIQ